MKQVIDLRPVYHRLEQLIRAHVILCWLGLLLVRIAEGCSFSEGTSGQQLCRMTGLWAAWSSTVVHSDTKRTSTPGPLGRRPRKQRGARPL
jgi:hypothetical protein